MSITSLDFIIFLCLVIGIYYVIPKKIQWVFLLIANMFFYLSAGPKYIIYLLVTIITTWYGAIRIDAVSQSQGINNKDLSVEDKNNIKKKKRRILVSVLIINFGILGFLKYFNFLFGDIIRSVLATGESGQSEMVFKWILPLGISFYTFQSMGYLIDIYWGKYQPERNIAKYALFASFFPQMVQGPIGRYEELAPQLKAEHFFSYEQVKNGALLMLWGFFKKIVIADRVSNITSAIFIEADTYKGVFILIAMLAYTIQIYMDFSGGIDIVTGAAQTLGIKLAVNFRRPYFAKDVPEFWRRWHITLGDWFRDYVFYPLSLSKAFNKLGKKVRKKVGIRLGKLVPVVIPQFIVFFLIGVWHGANWKYVAFGFYHGILIVGTILLEEPIEKLWKKFHIDTKSKIWQGVQMLFTFGLVTFGRVITQAPELSDCTVMIKSIFATPCVGALRTGEFFELCGISKGDLAIVGVGLLIVLIVSTIQEKGIEIRNTLAQKNIVIRWSVYLFMLLFTLIFGIYGIGYDASDFVYRGF